MIQNEDSIFRAIATAAQDGIVVMNDMGEVIFWNEAATKIFGYSKDEVIGKNLHHLLAPNKYKEHYERGLKDFFKTGEGDIVGKTIELDAMSKHRDSFPIELTISSVKIDGSWCAVGIVRDISERKKIDEELKDLNFELQKKIEEEIEKKEERNHALLQHSRLVAMGEMINSIAHHWRQPISAIGLIFYKLELAKESGKLDDKMFFESTSQGSALVEQMSKVIDDFRGFFKPNSEKKKFFLYESLDMAVHIIRAAVLEEDIDIKIEGDANIPLCGYPNELAQVFINIMTNAKDAISEKKEKRGSLKVLISHDDERVSIEFQDSGGGIADDVLNRVFEPYFTTKEQGYGTGIGLYMSMQIITKNMNGNLSVKNIDNGACFTIELPIAKEQ